MGYYVGLLIFIFVANLFTGQMTNTERGRKIFFFLTCLAVVLFQGFRSFTVGTDLATYIPDYSRMGAAGFTGELEYKNYEAGYVVLNKLLYMIGFDERGFLLVVTAIIQIPIFYTMYRYSEKPMMSILWYFAFGRFIMTFSGIRQSIAMSICFLAYYLIKERKPIYFVLLILFAALFHASALFCLILYPLYYMKLDRRKVFLAIALLIVVYIFRGRIFAFFSLLYYGEARETSVTGAYTMFITYLLLFIISFFGNREEDKDFMGMRNILLVLVMVYSFAPMHDYVTRIGYPLALYMSIYIPKLINSFEVVPKWLYYGICYVVLVVAFFYFLGGMETLPFSFG